MEMTMMATKSPSKSHSKKSAKPSKSAKPDATSTERLRKSFLKEIGDRIAKGEQADAAPTATKSDTSLHEGTITRADGEVVKVSVPANHSEQGAPPETSPTAPKPTKPTKPKAMKAEKAPKQPREPRKPKPAKALKPKRVSALDAAAIVLADTRKPMRAIDLIARSAFGP
jgi:hypothetical protein